MLDTFYATVAQVCFALLGLWWVVIQFKYQAWIKVPARRRIAFNISHYFVLPGVMSLVAILAANTKILWQAAFILTGLLGAFETLSIIFSNDLKPARPRLLHTGGWIQLVLYLIVVLTAINAALAQPILLRLTPLEIEGVCVSLLLFLGVNLAWTFFSDVEEND
jgi:fluoride ion exporter CrcB/FEX